MARALSYSDCNRIFFPSISLQHAPDTKSRFLAKYHLYARANPQRIPLRHPRRIDNDVGVALARPLARHPPRDPRRVRAYLSRTPGDPQHHRQPSHPSDHHPMSSLSLHTTQYTTAFATPQVASITVLSSATHVVSTMICGLPSRVHSPDTRPETHVVSARFVPLLHSNSLKLFLEAALDNPAHMSYIMASGRRSPTGNRQPLTRS